MYYQGEESRHFCRQIARRVGSRTGGKAMQMALLSDGSVPSESKLLTLLHFTGAELLPESVKG